jgi:type IV secretion system protein VirB2
MLGTGIGAAGSGSLVAAATWLEQVLLGPAATAVAVISVAAIGFMMLAGRIDWRRAATVVVGCFIIFGARAVAGGIAAAAGSGSGSGYDGASEPGFATPPPPAPAAPPTAAPPPTAPADPFAGAAVPSR